MNLWLRLVLTVLRARLGGALDPLATAVTPFRVWPHDLDVNAHMNNGRYATLMDLGRVDLMVRAGVAGTLMRAGMHPVVAAQHISYRRSLAPFERFAIETRVTGWDERSIYLEQVFRRADGEEAARGVLRTLFLDRAGRVPTARVVAMLGMERDLPPPEEARRLFPRPETGLDTGPETDLETAPGTDAAPGGASGAGAPRSGRAA